MQNERPGTGLCLRLHHSHFNCPHSHPTPVMLPGKGGLPDSEIGPVTATHAEDLSIACMIRLKKGHHRYLPLRWIMRPTCVGPPARGSRLSRPCPTALFACHVVKKASYSLVRSAEAHYKTEIFQSDTALTLSAAFIRRVPLIARRRWA
jgi:hypothetical protein